MTLTLTFDLDLEKFTQGQNFLNISIKENLPNMNGYYAQDIIYCWRQRSRSSKRSDSLNWL